MAKFCGNCGAKMDDSARICGICGTPFGAVPKIKIVDPEMEKEKTIKIKKHIRRMIIFVALILVGMLVFSVISNFTGANGLLRKVMTAYEDYDIDALVDMSSDMYFYGTEDYAENYFESVVGYSLDSFESAVGHSYKLSYEVKETYTMSNRNATSMLEEIARAYADFDTSIIEEIVVAEITVTAHQGKKSATRDMSITMTKESGSWSLLYIG